MKQLDVDAVLKSFDQPDETRTFEKGVFHLVKIGQLTIGKATYQPGWRWSKHVAPLAQKPLCDVEHTGMVLEGHAVAAFEDGEVIDLKPGNLFYIPPTPHDSWVVGDEPYVFVGAEHYSKRAPE